MFAKLLKQEWRATRNVIGLLCVIILLSGLFIGLSTGYISNRLTDSAPWVETLCVIVTMVCFLAVGVCCAAGVIYLICHYYQSRFTHQGYLTFTLPVTQHQLLLSGMVNIILGAALVVLCACLAAALALGLIVLAIPENAMMWKELTQEFGMLWDMLWQSLGAYGGTLLHFLASGLVYALSSLILLMLAVTVGAIIAKKHKLLATAAVYYGIHIVQSTLLIVFLPTSPATGFTALLNTTLVISLLLAVAGYFLMYHLTTKKLNLTD